MLEADKMTKLVIGDRVVLTEDVERFPHFIAAAGSIGTVSHLDGDCLCVKMDKLIPGAEEWDNEVVWNTEDIEFFLRRQPLKLVL